MIVNDKLLATSGPVIACIYAILLYNSDITNEEIAIKVGVSTSTVKRTIAELIKMGLIERNITRGKKNKYKVIPIEDTQSTEQKRTSKSKEEKKTYGKSGFVTLTDTEYAELVAEFGKETAEAGIQRADDYSKEQDTQYSNNAKYIRKWLKEGLFKQGNRFDDDIIQTYGAEGIVKMAEREYENLIRAYGSATIDDYIKRMESYYHASGKTYSDYAYKIKEWIEKDKTNPTNAKAKQPYTGNRRNRKGKPTYNFSGKSYRMLIDELPIEERERYYKALSGKYAKYLDQVAEMPLPELLENVEKEKMYMSFVNQFDEEDDNT